MKTSSGLKTLTLVLVLSGSAGFSVMGSGYPIVDTGQQACYDDAGSEITPPPEGMPFAGQDAQVQGWQPEYVVSDDELSVSDRITGLTWTRSPDLNGDGTIDVSDKLSWSDALAYPATLNAARFGGYDDWRLPTIKELYSLIVFSGLDPSGWSGDPAELVPFIDTSAFEFGYGDEAGGERLIDAQFWTSTEYVSTTMNGDHTVFGVNFADGRIKGYPTMDPQGGVKECYVYFVRGNPDYGINEFESGGDGTVLDLATGLVWQQADDGVGRNWESALAYTESLELGGCSDWTLPNVKELQSILDYTRSPDTSNSAAIDPLFSCSTITDEGGGEDYPFFWSSTTHANMATLPGAWGAYVAFGEALGWMQPPMGGSYNLMDVHGAGAQRSDPKSGDPAEYPYGNGPQGDVVRIDNHVRAVRSDGIPSCEIRVEDSTSTRLSFYPSCPAQPFEVVTGLVSELREDGDFSRALCSGSFMGSMQDGSGNPLPGEAWYYLAKGMSSCSSRAYGASAGLEDDPRAALAISSPCD